MTVLWTETSKNSASDENGVSTKSFAEKCKKGLPLVREGEKRLLPRKQVSTNGTQSQTYPTWIVHTVRLDTADSYGFYPRRSAYDILYANGYKLIQILQQNFFTKIYPIQTKVLPKASAH